ncbi:glycosyltransferase family 4 protein [Brevirhabdus sp.]|uniref:glycosyltransferase family 4 protein n=1 Tax=Brevirhabdus sp. TaxID=2004514 RepID=UPI00405A049D
MKILLAHGDLSARGGAEAYAQAMIAHLLDQGHQVDVLDIAGLRPAARGPGPQGSGPQGSDPLSGFPLLRLGHLPGLRRLHLVKYALVCRMLPHVIAPPGAISPYDRLILSYGEGPALPRPTLTLRHAPALFSTAPAHLRALGAGSPGALLLRGAYTWLCRRLAGMSDAAAAVDTPTPSRLIANSRWTAAMIPPQAGRAHVLYPQVRHPPASPDPLGDPSGDLPGNPSGDPPRDPFRIVTLGRIVPNKRLGDALRITALLRARGLPARLDIAGRADTPYARRLIRRLRGHPHVQIHPDIAPEALARLLARARLGLHCYRHEHFGIAIGEMILAGVLPVIHDGGGAVELVTDPALRYRTPQEAVPILARLMRQDQARIEAMVARLRTGPALQAALEFPARLEDMLAPFLSPGPAPLPHAASRTAAA